MKESNETESYEIFPVSTREAENDPTLQLQVKGSLKVLNGMKRLTEGQIQPSACMVQRVVLGWLVLDWVMYICTAIQSSHLTGR
ncbi:MAG: hypothetical protein P4M12_05590 [Gammaproteobacteria bacterium]|nr:hypothetical protein [Gammaproteobacteria bacterium]